LRCILAVMRVRRTGHGPALARLSALRLRVINDRAVSMATLDWSWQAACVALWLQHPQLCDLLLKGNHHG